MEDMSEDYMELGLEETIREGDFYILNSGTRSLVVGNWIGLKVCESPWKIYRPHSTLIRDAAIELLRDAYGDDEIAFGINGDTYTTVKGSLVAKLREAFGISIEQLRKGGEA